MGCSCKSGVPETRCGGESQLPCPIRLNGCCVNYSGCNIPELSILMGSNMDSVVSSLWAYLSSRNCEYNKMKEAYNNMSKQVDTLIEKINNLEKIVNDGV